MSKIEWTDKTWNPVSGCDKISEGCTNCYAETMAKQLKAMGTPGYENGFKVTLHPDKLDVPLKWKKPCKIFVCSMGDLFHEDVPFEFILKVIDIIRESRNGYSCGLDRLVTTHTFQILTKRPERMRDFFNRLRYDSLDNSENKELYLANSSSEKGYRPIMPNIWLGVTAENQEQANKRIPILLNTPAAKRFVSIEPMLGPVDLTDISYYENDGIITSAPTHKEGIVGGSCHMDALDSSDLVDWPDWGALDWVIVGGESGTRARPMHLDWVCKIRDDCKDAGVPFFFKQWGEWESKEIKTKKFNISKMQEQSKKTGIKSMCTFIKQPGEPFLVFKRVGKKKAGSKLDGVEHKEMPCNKK